MQTNLKLFFKISFFILFMAGALSFPIHAELEDLSPAAESDYLNEALQFEEKTDFLGEGENLKLPSIGEVAFRMFFFLMIVLLLMFGFALAAQRFFKNTPLDKSLNQDVIKVLCYRKFDMKKGIYLVDVFGKILILGSDIEGLNLITEITEPEAVAEARKMADVTPEIYKLNPFQGILEKFSGNYSEEAQREHRREKQTRGLLSKIDQLKHRLVP